MRSTIFCGIGISVLAGLISGCQAGPSIVRGQSPAESAPAAGEVVQAGFRPGRVIYGQTAVANCPPCQGGYCAPRQYYRSSYRVPNGLVYPPPDAMPGMVQYPYYTVKGPDCFFYKGE